MAKDHQYIYTPGHVFTLTTEDFAVYSWQSLTPRTLTHANLSCESCLAWVDGWPRFPPVGEVHKAIAGHLGFNPWWRETRAAQEAPW
jgi:hypothetical protein